MLKVSDESSRSSTVADVHFPATTVTWPQCGRTYDQLQFRATGPICYYFHRSEGLNWIGDFGATGVRVVESCPYRKCDAERSDAAARISTSACRVMRKTIRVGSDVWPSRVNLWFVLPARFRQAHRPRKLYRRPMKVISHPAITVLPLIIII